NTVKHQYTPVGWNIAWQLSVKVKNAEDGAQIIEQIIPTFRPDFTPSVQLIPETGEIRDIPIILDSMQQTDVYSEDFTQRRMIEWLLTFTMKAWFYGPVINKPIIKTTKTNFYFDDSDPVSTVTMTPGLTLDGEPTNNPDLTVPPDDIHILDNYGYVEQHSGL